MESKELFYILLIIILILNLCNKKETFINLLNKKDTFLNSKNNSKENIKKCCDKNCYDKPKHLRDKNCKNNKIKNKNNLKKQNNSSYKSLQNFYDSRYKFEKEPLGDNKPLVEQPERQKRLINSLAKKEYVPAFQLKNNSVKNTGKPGFYIQ
jgi:ABC-type uncharacterized transport system ATPase subunit